MECPIDGTQLLMSERQGIEIDYCPKCRGVWLDRGELDKIIDRNDQPPSPADPSGRPQKSHGKSSKKKSFLSEIFELGG